VSEYIFHVEYGGLGDHLFYSPLPRLLKEHGIADKVYLSTASRFRSAETYDLVWGTNPYLDGRSDAPPTKTTSLIPSVNKIINLAIAEHSLVPRDELNPEIYLPDQVADRYVGNHYIDFNYTSYTGAFTMLDALRILRKDPQLVVVNPSKKLSRYIKNRHVVTTSLWDYALLIKSAGSFAALASGGATLSLALGRPCTMYYAYGHNQLFRHSANQNICIGGNNIIRKLISRYLIKRNSLRIKRSPTY